jgi:hypothetical protein
MRNPYLCIGYVPLFYVDQERDFVGPDDKQELLDFLKNRVTRAPMVGISACLYGNYMGRPVPVLACNRAREVIEHLLAYSKGNPNDYFKLYVDRYKTGYYLVLQPIVQKAMDRFRESQKLRGRQLDEKVVIQVLFKHLAFFSARIGSFEKIEGSKSLHVGFIDENDLDLNDAQVMPEPTFIGPLEVGDGKDMNIGHMFEQ